MSKSLPEDLAEFLLGLQQGSWTRQYVRECLELWKTTYSEKVSKQVEAIVMERMKL